MRASGLGMPTRSRSSAARAVAAFRFMPKCVSSGSRSWRPIVSTGFRLVIGSWKIIAICRPRTRRSARWLRLRRSRPSKRAVPERTRPARGSRPRRARAVTLLPQPDSPTIPRVSPGPMSNEIPFTACTVPPPVQKWTRRSSTLNKGSLRTPDRRPPAPAEEPERLPLAEPPHPAAELWVERLPQAVADQVEAEHGDDDRDPRRDRVREDVRKEDYRPPHAHGARGEHEVVLALREHGAAEQPREDRDVHDPDRDHDLVQAGVQDGDDPDREEQAGDRQHHVHAAHDQRVDEAADVARDRAEDEADREADRDRDDPDDEREPRAVEDPAVHVAAQLVDAEPVLVRRPGAAAARDQEQVLLLRRVGREQRRERRRDDEDQDEDGAEDRRGVAHEPPERVAPEPAGRRLERDLVGF